MALRKMWLVSPSSQVSMKTTTFDTVPLGQEPQQRLIIVEIAVARRIIRIEAGAAAPCAERRQLHYHRAGAFNRLYLVHVISASDCHPYGVSVVTDEVDLPAVGIMLDCRVSQMHLNLPFAISAPQRPTSSAGP
jgi:hypothetical protein